MKIIKTTLLSFICVLMLTSTAQAEENALKGLKLGFGFDRDFGVVGTIGKLNGFLGNDGVAIDYIFMKKKLDETNPLYWYVGGGGFVDWDGDFGVRLPVGGELYFAENLDAYAQIIPRLRFNNNSNDRTDFGLDFGIGVRYQF
jgi:hypothetical protein